MKKILIFTLIAFCIATFNCYCQEDKQEITIKYLAEIIGYSLIEEGIDLEPLFITDKTYSLSYKRDKFDYQIHIGNLGSFFYLSYQTHQIFRVIQETDFEYMSKVVSDICNELNKENLNTKFTFYESSKEEIDMKIEFGYFYMKNNFNKSDFMQIHNSSTDRIYTSRKKIGDKVLELRKQ